MEGRAGELKTRTSRILSVGLILLVMMLVLIGRFFYYIFCAARCDIEEAFQSREIIAQIPARRGEIRDASGHTLAIEVLRYHVFCHPQDIRREEWLNIAEKLGPVVGQNREALLKSLEEGYKKVFEFNTEEGRELSAAGLLYYLCAGRRSQEAWAG